MIAIHNNKTGYRDRWVSYCEENGIPYKIVNCYDTDIIEQLQECDALMWHFSPNNVGDLMVAKPILFTLDQMNFPVFPDWRTCWHFEDKVAQKYLLEAAGAPVVPSYVFVDRQTALDWVERTEFPKVCKLRTGSSSSGVFLVKTRAEARRMVKRSFGRGIKQYQRWGSLQERWRQYRIGKTDLQDVLRGVARLFVEPEFSRVAGPERGYIYFQDFLAGNDSDIRVVTVHGKAVSKKRMVRKNDFRASGSGNQTFAREAIDERCVEIALRTNRDLGVQALNYDFIYNAAGEPEIVEISYGATPRSIDKYPGYWDEDMVWHAGPCNFSGWMVDGVLAEIERAKSKLMTSTR